MKGGRSPPSTPAHLANQLAPTPLLYTFRPNDGPSSMYVMFFLPGFRGNHSAIYLNHGQLYRNQLDLPYHV